MVRLLLENGADVDVADDDGLTPIMFAILFHNIDTTKLLIEHGANINCRDNIIMQTPLHFAADEGLEEVVELLLNHGADIEAKTKNDGLTPLHTAVTHGQKKTVRTLLQHNADTNALNNRNQTALNIAVYSQSIISQHNQTAIDAGEIATEKVTKGLKVIREIIELLIDNGARINLHDAVLLEDVDRVKDLLAKGVDINTRNDYDQTTALHLAVYSNQLNGRVFTARRSRHQHC